MGWACVCRVRPSSYGCLEMLSVRIVVRMELWVGVGQVSVAWFAFGDLGTCKFVDVKNFWAVDFAVHGFRCDF